AASCALQPETAETASASAASCCATAGGMRAGFGGGAASRLPQPTRSAALDATSQAFRQRIRQPPFADLFLRPLDRVGHSPKRSPARVEVEQQPRRPRVAVARLADRAGVEEKARVRGELGLGSVGCEAAR